MFCKRLHTPKKGAHTNLATASVCGNFNWLSFNSVLFAEGKPLVHSSQLAWLRGVAQARLAAAGLSGALTALRYFCRSLSLELLYTQTLRLCRDRLSRHLQVDRYVPGQKLQVSYWR